MPHDSTTRAGARERAPSDGSGLMTGFPPAPEAQVTLANWQDPPYSRWAFRHMRELIPSHPIPAGPGGPGGAALLPAAPWPLPDPPVGRIDGSTATAAEVFADTYTDALVVLKDGQLVAERYDAGMTAATPHLLMSVSKSLVGCVAGVLADRGLLDPAAPVTAYVPEAGDSGYAGATVRHLLDMRTGVAFRETYAELDAEVRVMERSMGWRPAQPGDPAGAYPYLITLGQAGPHGGEFTYRSADSDMLGWVCERASGTRMADLIGALIWQPMGAERDGEITCDPLGSAIHDGGVSATARDLARFGQLLVDDGMARGLPGRPGGLAGRHPRPRPRRPRGLRGYRERAGPARRLVPQPVLGHPGNRRAGAGLPRHPRPAGLRRPCRAHRGGQAVVLAGPAAHRLPAGHAASLRRAGRPPVGREGL